MLAFHYNTGTAVITTGLVVGNVNNVPMPRYDVGDPRALQRPLINDPATGEGTLGQRFRNYSGDGTGGELCSGLLLGCGEAVETGLEARTGAGLSPTSRDRIRNRLIPRDTDFFIVEPPYSVFCCPTAAEQVC